MSSQTFDGDSIGPQIALEDVRLPPHVGAELASLYGRDGRIETAAGWIDEMRAASQRVQGRPPTAADLCRVDDGNHTVEFGGRGGTDEFDGGDVTDDGQSFVCVLDPLAVPFLRERPGTVRSTTPEDGLSVTVTVGADAVAVDPETAVVSLGVSTDLDPDEPVTIERMYREVCAYVHVFASPGEYARWADGVDAATTSVPVDTGVAIARGIAGELFAASEQAGE